MDTFCQDDYAKPTISIPKVQGVPDWERPSTIKWDALTAAVKRSTANVKIVEGLFAFYPASLRSIYNVRIFIEIDKEMFQSRRSQDDRWEQEPDWYPEHVWRSYLKYGMMKGDKAEYIKLDGAEKIDVKKVALLLHD